MKRRILFVVLALAMTPAGRAAEFAFKDGDRVVLIGGTFIERDQSYGYLETMLTLRHPDKTITFRNLGWSGDTVWGDARAGFETAKEGFQRLKEHVHALKPTVIFVGYGMVESFEGKAGLAKFEEGLKALLDMLAETEARIVLISPIPHQNLGSPLPDPSEHNANLRLYSDAIDAISKERGHRFVNLFKALSVFSVENSTDNGIHPTSFGSHMAAMLIHTGLQIPPIAKWYVSLDAEGVVSRSVGARVEDIRRAPTGVRFRATDERLPVPLIPMESPPSNSYRDRTLRVKGLGPGRYALRIDGEDVALSRYDSKRLDSATDDEWAYGIAVIDGSEREQADGLRRTINAKNLLYFHRWRPQNETYLFGFRKHEQGQNAREVPLFDPLVAEKEAEIAKLKVPVPHTYELVRVEEKPK